MSVFFCSIKTCFEPLNVKIILLAFYANRMGRTCMCICCVQDVLYMFSTGCVVALVMNWMLSMFHPVVKQAPSAACPL